MKKLIVLLALLLATPSHAIMMIGFGGGAQNIAFDAESSSAYSTTNLSWTHTPIGTPRGVIVWVFQYNNGGDHVVSVTYGGVSMTEVTGSPRIKVTGELMVVYAYFLGSSIPTGAQTVAIAVDAGTEYKKARAITLTATGDTSITDTTTIGSDSVANPSGTLSLGGVESICLQGYISGHDDPASVTSFSNWSTSPAPARSAYDFGTEVAINEVYGPVSTSDVTMGATQTAEDINGIGIAVRVAP